MLKSLLLFVQQSYTFYVENGQKMDEDVDVSVKGNFVQYHVENKNAEVWVINDFNTVSHLQNSTHTKNRMQRQIKLLSQSDQTDDRGRDVASVRQDEATASIVSYFPRLHFVKCRIYL